MAKINLSSLYNLEDLALETGATVEYTDGRKFNTAGVQARRKPAAPVAAPAAPPPAPVAPPAPPANEALVKQLLELLNRPVQVSIPDLPTPQVTVNAPPAVRAPTKWVFDFDRNPNGTIRSITATAHKE